MKVLIIGGVAAGTKAAAKLKRRNQNVDVTIITKADEISYARMRIALLCWRYY